MSAVLGRYAPVNGDLASLRASTLAPARLHSPSFAPDIPAPLYSPVHHNSVPTSVPNSMPNRRTRTNMAPATAASTLNTSVLRQLGLLTQWNFLRGSTMFPLLIVVQTLLASTTVFGYGMLIGDLPPEPAMFLATGAATVNLIMVGLVLAPQGVSQSKTEGSLGWMRTLPVPRWVFLASDLIVYSIVALPGAALGLVLGAWHFGIDLSISPWLALAAPLVAAIATSVGYSLALLLKPQLAMMISQVLVFVILLFSPISIPTANLPSWLASAHEWLPIAPMADLMRASLISDVFTVEPRALAVLSVWTVATVFGASRALSKRQ